MFGSWVSAQETQPQTGTETGNIVYTTLNPPPQGAPFSWNGFIVNNTGGGGLQGGNIPAYNTETGTFIFGFFPGTIQYATAVNFALQNAGTGIKVNGFRYSWEYFNQDFSRGTLSTNIRLTNNAGQIVENYNYLLPKTTEGWTRMSGVENFSSLYSPSSLANLELTLTGKDDRFWAGYYGPQIRDIDVRLLYGTPPPSTPTIPTPTNITTSDIIAEVTAPATTTTIEPTTTQTVAQTTPVVETNTVSTMTPSTTSATTTQPVVAVAQTTREAAPIAQQTVQQTSQQSSQSSAAPSLSSVLSMIQTNQARENAIAQTAVAQANQVAQQAVKEAEQTAVATAMASSSQSMENSKESIRSETKDNKTANTNSGLPLVAATSSNVSTMNPGQSQPVTALQTPTISQQIMPGQQSSSNVVNAMANITIQPVINSSITNTQQQNNIAPAQTVNTMTTARTDLYSLLPPVPVVQEIPTQQQTSLPVNKSISAFTTETPSNSSSFFTNRADPLQDYVEKNSIMVAMAQPEVRPTTVRTNVQDSTLAGNVRVERLQVVPNGYSLYLSLILRDAAFYESKEIYKNNAIKDNVRTMYFIEKGNTDTFNKMIQMQYK